MKKLLLFILLPLCLMAGQAGAADPNASGTVWCIATGAATGGNLYPCRPLALNGDGGIPSHILNFPSSFGISGLLPAYASTPTFNLGTLNGAALDSSIQQLNTTLGGNIQVHWSGQSVTLSGTLPAFAATPTFNIGTAPTIAVTGTFWQATQPVSAVALPLPAGAATSSNQSTEITALQTVATASASQATAANQTTQITAEQTTATGTGAPADAAYSGSGSSSIIAALKGIYTKVSAAASSLAGTLTTADQNGAAFSSAVTLTAGGASDSVGRSVEMLVTVAGNVSMQMSGSPHIISVAASPYTQTFPYAITAINSSGTTATATYANLH